jgi:hypothetical protein
MSANVPIIRKKPEGQAEHLLRLVISHPDGVTPPQIDFFWDGDWVRAQNLPPNFAQQIFGACLQTLWAAGLVVCGNVIPPQPPLPGGQN